MILWIVLRLCDLYCGKPVPQGFGGIVVSLKREKGHGRIWWSLKSTWPNYSEIWMFKGLRIAELRNRIWETTRLQTPPKQYLLKIDKLVFLTNIL